MSFSGDIRKHSDKYQKRMRAVYRNSVQEVAEDANTPVVKGGNMRVATGFLRNSQAFNLGQMPSGPTRGEPNQHYTSRIGAGPVEILGRWQPGNTVFVGWTANYARFRNAKDGFMSLAAQKWNSIVRRNAEKAKRAGL